MKNTLLIFTNPEFDKRHLCGISRLYQVFSKKYGFNIEFINDDFLKNFIPEGNSGQILVIAGGDGTIHRVINLIPDKVFEKYIFGIIPAGTANEFARSIKLPLDLEEAAEVIANQKHLVCQRLGIINKQYKFFTGFLYGIACKVLQDTPPLAKQYLGAYAYHLPVFFSIANYNEYLKIFRINFDEISTGYLLINNASLISKEVNIEQIKTENPELFSLVYLPAELGVSDFARLIIKNRPEGNILEDISIFYRQEKEIVLEFEGQLDFMLDGENYTLNSPIKFEHSEYCIKVFA